jgi:PTS system nitrogen regulatory IIA component
VEIATEKKEGNMNFTDLVRTDLTCILEETNKSEAILKLIDLVRKAGLVTDVAALTRDIFYREQLMSTGVGLGLAIPHVRFKGITMPVIAIGVKPRGIPDYQSIDDRPVTIVIMILVGENQHKEHIRLLAQIVAIFKNEETRNAVIAAASADEICSILKGISNA